MNLVIFTVGIIIGMILRYAFAERKKPSGTFVMDFSDPLKDICRLELDEDINALYSKKYITLKVKVYEEHSHN